MMPQTARPAFWADFASVRTSGAAGGTAFWLQVGRNIDVTLREFYIDRRRAESPAFLRVLKELPTDAVDYKPHERSPTAQQLVWTLTSELKACLDVVTQNKTERQSLPPPPLPEMVQLFEQWSNELKNCVSKMDEASWNRTAQFYYNGKVVSEQPVGQFLWFILFDAIHHRGQLSAYLRPMGGKVPAIYGPSADERPA
jgi:uncharacterized damage-inducible protein DinB